MNVIRSEIALVVAGAAAASAAQRIGVPVRSVTILALENDETLEADEETERMLLEAIAQCERRQTTPMSDLPDELRSGE